MSDLGTTTIYGDLKVTGKFNVDSTDLQITDADTVDGKHAKDFASASHDHNAAYVGKTGNQTITGNLTVNTNILLGSGSTDVYMRNIKSEKYLQLRDDGVLQYDNADVYTAKRKPTKADVGLNLVNNWGATTAVNSNSATTYATASAVKTAYDKGVEALNKANEAVNAATGSGIKSVQRGMLNVDNTQDAPAENGVKYMDITISPVNMNKSFLLFGSSYAGGSTSAPHPNGRFISSTVLRVYTNAANTSYLMFRNATWQVVEFY